MAKKIKDLNPAEYNPRKISDKINPNEVFCI